MRLYANPFNTQDVRFDAGFTNVIYEANVEGLELETLQLRNKLNLLDNFFFLHNSTTHTASHC